jgi:hypothetical protein
VESIVRGKIVSKILTVPHLILIRRGVLESSAREHGAMSSSSFLSRKYAEKTNFFLQSSSFPYALLALLIPSRSDSNIPKGAALTAHDFIIFASARTQSPCVFPRPG